MKVTILNFVGGPGTPLLNVEGGPGVPLLNFRGSRVPLLNFEGGPGSRNPGPTFRPCHDATPLNKNNLTPNLQSVFPSDFHIF